jgi:CRISPR-associated endonuclease Cas1
MRTGVPKNDALIRGEMVVIRLIQAIRRECMSREISWLTVYGFGAHIKSTQNKLIILKKGTVEEYPLDEIKNLLIVGGHTLNSTTLSRLIKNGAYIFFFEPDGIPVGIIRPYGDRSDEVIRNKQRELPRHRYAVALAQAAVRSRLIAIEKLQETRGIGIFYEGELQFLHKSLEELEYLVKLEEIRRLSRLTSDMYYEIISRAVPESLGFHRRTIRPQCDPVNSMFSFGYSILFGNCCVAVIGARMDPDTGVLHEGPGALVNDLIEPFKAGMIDPVVMDISCNLLVPDDFEQTQYRCLLSDSLIQKMTLAYKTAIDNEKIEKQVDNFMKALMKTDEFRVMF